MNEEAATEKLTAVHQRWVRREVDGTLAAALLPVVREIAAEELRAAASEVDEWPTHNHGSLLRNRAGFLDGSI